MATVAKLLTAEAYAALPDDGRRTELVRGEIVEMNVPQPYHGFVVLEIAARLREYVARHDLGRVIASDGGFVTRREPDSVRGPDVSYYSFDRLPRGPFPRGYLVAPPELALEVRSPGNSRRELLEKLDEYLRAGVVVGVIVDPEEQTAVIRRRGKPDETIAEDQEFSLPELFPGFAVLLREFFG